MESGVRYANCRLHSIFDGLILAQRYDVNLEIYTHLPRAGDNRDEMDLFDRLGYITC